MKKTYIASCYFKHNYGSMLQAYATQYFLDKNNIENETISIEKLCDFSKGKKRYYAKQIFNLSFYKAKMGMIKLLVKKKICPNLRKKFKLRDLAFSSFKDNNFRLTPAFSSYKEIHNFCKENAQNVIVGSDQLWLPVNVVADYYTLTFVPDEINKISYATSFGVSFIAKSMEKKYKKYLERIDHISVREDSGKRIVESLTDKKCTVVCDPTLLLTKSDWLNFLNPDPVENEKYIFCYFLGKSKRHRKFAERLKKITGFKIVSVNHCDEFVKYSDKFADSIPYNVGPAEWLNLIDNAQYICTDSFHGTVFSLIFNKKFFAFRRFTKKSAFSTNSRLDTLLSVAGINDRVFSGDEREEKIKDILKFEIDFEEVNSRLREYRAFSGKFLLNSLEGNS